VPAVPATEPPPPPASKETLFDNLKARILQQKADKEAAVAAILAVDQQQLGVASEGVEEAGGRAASLPGQFVPVPAVPDL